MDEGQAVHEHNLVDDQVAQAIVDSGADAPQVVSPAVPTVQPLSEQADAQPEATPLTGADAISDQPVEPSATPLIAPPAADAPTASVLPTPAPVTSPVPAPSQATPAEQPQEELPDLSVPATAAPVVAPNLGDGSGNDDELMSVKQQALEQLSPLVSHLDLPADQKFDTYMEIIRASDDKTLIQPAFEAAQAIEDEDKKAQALLDVVNEVNYLTQEQGEDEATAI